MRSLVFDTETTGLIDFKARPPYPQRVIQLGAALYFERRLVGELNIILNTGAEIPSDSIAVHNITPELVEAVGLSPKVGVPMFNQLLRVSDRLVAHNLD